MCGIGPPRHQRLWDRGLLEGRHQRVPEIIRESALRHWRFSAAKATTLPHIAHSSWNESDVVHVPCVARHSGLVLNRELVDVDAASDAEV